MKKLLLFILTTVFHAIGYSQLPNIDSLKVVAENKKGKAQIILYSDISYYSTYSDIEQSINYAEKCLLAAKNHSDSLLIAEAYNALAIAYYASSDYKKSLAFNMDALKIRLNHGNPYSLVSSYSKIGNCYFDIGEMDEAITYYLKALEITEKENLLRESGLLANNIAEIFRKEQQFNKADEYYKKAILVAEKQQDTLGWCKALINQGINAENQKKYSDSDSIYQFAESLLQNQPYLDVKAGLYINQGVLYKSLGKIDLSINYYLKAKEIYQQTGEIHGLAIVNTNLGNTYLQIKKYQLAYQHYQKGLELAIQTNSMSRVQFAHEQFVNYYKATHNYEQALAELNIANSLKDSIYSTEKSRIIEELNLKYETEKKEKLLAEKETALAYQRIRNQQKNNLLIIVLASLVLLVVTATYIYFYLRKRNEKLKQDVAFEKTNTLNKIQDEKLRISRDLHDNIGAQLTFVISTLDNLKFYKSSKIKEEKIATLGSFTRNTMLELRDTIWAMNASSISGDELNTKIVEFINTVRQIDPNIKIISQFNDTSHSHIYTNNEAIQIFRCIQEAINNAIKHANATKITIKLTKHEIQIYDNGIGFDKNSVAAGNGLNNMHQRVKELGYKLILESKQNEGTMIKILF